MRARTIQRLQIIFQEEQRKKLDRINQVRHVFRHHPTYQLIEQWKEIAGQLPQQQQVEKFVEILGLNNAAGFASFCQTTRLLDYIPVTGKIETIPLDKIFENAKRASQATTHATSDHSTTFLRGRSVLGNTACQLLQQRVLPDHYKTDL